MPRFFVSKELILDGTVSVVGDDARHIARSLRMAVGDEVVICDRENTEYLCRLTKIRDDECNCEIIEHSEGKGESPVRITLCMAYPKGDKLETIIQKAVELGASRIIPFESSRCIKKPKEEKIEKQLARLTKIAEEAAKQCGRCVLPTVSTPRSFADMLKEANDSELTILCYEAERGMTIKKLLKDSGNPASIAVIVGAEGGFSEDEVRLATESGARAVSLGNRILRCETAPLFAISAINYELEL